MKFRLGQQIIDKIRGKKAREVTSRVKVLTSFEEINAIQRTAWFGENDAAGYYSRVEHNVFDAVAFDYFKEYLRPEYKVLDVGAGTGRLSLKIAALGCEVVASDISGNMLKYLDSAKGDLNITTVICEGEKMPFEDNSFDVVTSFDLMVHILQWRNVLKEKVRFVKNGGYIIYSAYNGDNFVKISPTRNPQEIADRFMGDSHYYCSTTKSELESFCDENNCELIKLQPYDLLSGTNLWCDVLTAEECATFRTLYGKACGNPEFLKIITQFERNIVRNMPPEDCMRVIVVIRKK